MSPIELSWTAKKSFFFSELQEVEVRICVQPNFPIIILILLNGFHKFGRSRGLDSCAGKVESRMALIMHYFLDNLLGLIYFTHQ